MLRVAWKGLLGHKVRFALTTLAVVLGVAFVVGSFVFTDTLGRAFDNLFTDAFAGTDVTVRATQGLEELGAEPVRLPGRPTGGDRGGGRRGRGVGIGRRVGAGDQ